MTSAPRHVRMIWTREIDGQAMAGRLRVALAIRTALQAGARVEEHILRPMIDRPLRPLALFRGLWAWIVSLLSGRPLPLQCVLYADWVQFAPLLDAVDPENDVVYLDGIRTLPLLRALRRRYPMVPVVVDLDDLMSRRMQLLRSADQPLSPGHLTNKLPHWAVWLVMGPVGRIIVWYEALTLPAMEREVTELADHVVLLSSADMRELGGRGAARRWTILPPVTARCEALRITHEPTRFIFVGTDALTQNRLTIDYLLDLWRRERFGSELVLFGRQQRRLDLPPGVSLAGYVPDIDSAYDGRSVLLSPSFLQGGIKTKVLEAFAHGAAVIGNPATFEALALIDYPLCLAEESALVEVLRAPERYRMAFQTAAEIGLELVRTRHHPDQFAREWLALIDQCGRGARPAQHGSEPVPVQSVGAQS